MWQRNEWCDIGRTCYIAQKCIYLDGSLQVVPGRWCRAWPGTPMHKGEHNFQLHIYGAKGLQDPPQEGDTYGGPYWFNGACCCPEGAPPQLLARCTQWSAMLGTITVDSARIVNYNKDNGFYEATLYPNGHPLFVQWKCNNGSDPQNLYIGWQFKVGDYPEYNWPFRFPQEAYCSPPKWVHVLDGSVWVGFSKPYDPASELDITLTTVPDPTFFTLEDGGNILLEDGSGKLQLEY